MSDRTEEAKALREFLKDKPGISEGYLAIVIEELKYNSEIFATMAPYRQELLQVLMEYCVVTRAWAANTEVVWSYHTDGKPYSASAYRIADGYELPDLTEVTPPRYANGTPLVYKPSGKVYIVADRVTDKPDDAPDDWCQFARVAGDTRSYTAYWDKHQELPPMPDTNKLAAQGYRRTMKAADCSKTRDERGYYVDHREHLHVYDKYCTSGKDALNGWRWLVEKIEQESEGDLDNLIEHWERMCVALDNLADDAKDNIDEITYQRLNGKASMARSMTVELKRELRKKNGESV